MSSILFEQIRKGYYILDEAASALQVTDVTVWRWIKSGKIRAEPLGRNVFIPKSEVERIKNERK
jgi:excisionase family DNA binding protein